MRDNNQRNRLEAVKVEILKERPRKRNLMPTSFGPSRKPPENMGLPTSASTLHSASTILVTYAGRANAAIAAFVIFEFLLVIYILTVVIWTIWTCTGRCMLRKAKPVDECRVQEGPGRKRKRTAEMDEDQTGGGWLRERDGNGWFWSSAGR